MDFSEIAKMRQSCRKYDTNRKVEEEKINSILEAARLSPSACNSQPYFITVCKGEVKNQVAKATQGMGMNKFATDADVILVISENNYSKSAALGAKIKHNDYRSIDIGILSAYITAQAASIGIGSCILGWFDNDEIREVCELSNDVRLVITLGYASSDDKLRIKNRKDNSELFKIK